jgi:transaldolase/glucose-6-phosphate isomerase
VATSVAGSVLGVNPFDQPDVEAAKVASLRVTAEFEETGKIQASDPACHGSGLQVFLPSTVPARRKIRDWGVSDHLRAHLSGLRKGDYFGIQAYIPMTGDHARALTRIRDLVRDRTHAATTAGFGPRFLHSTGQLHKGGPPSGVFLQITCEDAEDLPIPERAYTFGVVKAAQAAGDLAVLAERGRRILRVHLGPDVKAGLEALFQALTRSFLQSGPASS